MSILAQVPRKYLMFSVGLLIIAITLAGWLLLMSGASAGAAAFGRMVAQRLAPEQDIAGWASLDKASYLPGDRIRYRIRVLWRDDAVLPDLQSFESRISFFPFDHIDSLSEQSRAAGGIRAYTVEYLLQAVDVDWPASYRFDPPTFYYSSSGSDREQLRTLRIDPPVLYLGEFYPLDVSRIPLRPPKLETIGAGALITGLLAVAGIAFLSTGLVQLWRLGRRRSRSRLSEAERLWVAFRGMRHAGLDERQYLLECERIYTHALRLRCGVSPAEFWSGQVQESGALGDSVDEARGLFGRGYCPGSVARPDTERVSQIIQDLLAPMTKEDQLEREQEPSIAARLRKNPRRSTGYASLILVATILIIAALRPSVWAPPEVLRYNAAVGLVEGESAPGKSIAEFASLAADADDEEIRSAALYNVGTLMAKPPGTVGLRVRQQDFRRAIFMKGITLDKLLHALELDTEAELLTILADYARRYTEAETAMKAAVRLDPDDPDIRRNLELVSKIRRALSGTLAQLISQGEQDAGPQAMQRQTLIDLNQLMKTTMPEDFAELEARRTDQNYYIMESF